MSEVITPSGTTANFTECVLTLSDCYSETLSIKAIEAQPGVVELVIYTQLSSAKHPAEKRVKSRTCINESQLSDIRDAISHFLDVSTRESTGSSGEPVNR